MPRATTMALAGLPLLAACTPVDTGFGEALRWDMAQQVIDPDPQHDRTVMEGGSGERAAGAVGRYSTGEVTPVEQMGTTATISTGSGPN